MKALEAERERAEGLAPSMDGKGAGVVLLGSARTEDLRPGLQLRMRKPLSGS